MITRKPQDLKDFIDNGVQVAKMVYDIEPDANEVEHRPNSDPHNYAFELVVFLDGDVCLKSSDEEDGVPYMYPSQVRDMMKCLAECGIEASK
jgi:hypothetical protein